MAARIAVIGAGWAGLTAALRLAEGGMDVTLFEAAPMAGGRARRVSLPGFGLVDNGQHLLLGAYSETLALLDDLHHGRPPLARAPLALRMISATPSVEEFRFQAARLPAPLHLLVGLCGAAGQSTVDALHFAFRLGWRLRFSTPSASVTVTEWMQAFPRTAQTHMLAPLCLAALNTPAERASARVFVNVLRAAFLGASADSQFVLPRCDLGALFVDPVLRRLSARAATLRLATAVHTLTAGTSAVTLSTRNGAAQFDAAILAVAPQHARRLLAPHIAFAPTVAVLDTLTYEPISTTYLQHAPRPVPKGLVGSLDPLAQWFLPHAERGDRLTAVVSSGLEAHQGYDRDTLREAVQARARSLLGIESIAAQTITEHRATYACTPDAHQALCTLPWPVWQETRLFAAGDYTYPAFPATLESAVRSGTAAARQCLAALR